MALDGAYFVVSTMYNTHQIINMHFGRYDYLTNLHLVWDADADVYRRAHCIIEYELVYIEI